MDSETPYFLTNPRCVCAARVIVLGLCVCLSVCLRLFSDYRLRGGLWVIPTASVLQGQCGDFNTTAQQTIHYIQQLIRTWLLLLSNGFGVFSHVRCLARPKCKWLPSPSLSRKKAHRDLSTLPSDCRCISSRQRVRYCLFSRRRPCVCLRLLHNFYVTAYRISRTSWAQP